MENLSYEDMQELYPQNNVKAELTGKVIGNYTCTNAGVVLHKTDVKEIDPVIRDVWFPSVTDDSRYINKMKTLPYFFQCAFSDGVGLAVFIVFGLIAIICAGVCYTEPSYNTEGLAIVFGILSLLSFCGLICAAIAKSLKAYGLFKDMDVWLINFRDEVVVPAKLIGIHEVGRTVRETVFNCSNFGVVRTVRGTSLFFTQAAATDVLSYVLSSNDYELSQYYPKWREDIEFVKYYKTKLPTRGFAVNTENKTFALLAETTIINGITYEGAISAETLINSYLDTVNQKNIQKQKTIDAITDYHNKGSVI